MPTKRAPRMTMTAGRRSVEVEGDAHEDGGLEGEEAYRRGTRARRPAVLAVVLPRSLAAATGTMAQRPDAVPDGR